MAIVNASNVENLFNTLQHNFLTNICTNSSEHTSSTSTLPPSGFDAHLHPNLKLKSLAYNDNMLNYAITSLREAFAAQPDFPSTSDVSTWTDALLSYTSENIEGVLIENESDIFIVINIMLLAAGRIAGKSLIWDSKNLYKVSSAKGGSSITGITIHAHTGKATPNCLPPEILSLFTKLGENNVLIGSELRHCLLLHPGHLLFLYVFIYAIQKEKLANLDLLFPWPDPVRCRDCQKYRWTHSSHPGNRDTGVSSSDVGCNPYQSSDLDVLKTAISAVQDALRAWENVTPRELHNIWPIPTSKLGAVEEEIPDPTGGEEDGAQHQHPHSSQSPKTNAQQVTRIVQDCMNDLSIDVSYQPKVQMWLKEALIVTTQAWSRLVQNDTTYELVTNLGISWIIHRHRKNQTATFSPFFLADDPNLLLYLAALIHEAHLDAIDRQKLNSSNEKAGGLTESHGGSNTCPWDEGNLKGDQQPMPKILKSEGGSSKLVKPSQSEGAPEEEKISVSNPRFNIQELHFAFAVYPYFTDGYITLTRVPPSLSPVLVPATSRTTQSTTFTSPKSESLSKDASVVEHAAIIVTTLSRNDKIGRIGNGLLTTEKEGSLDIVVKLAEDHEDLETLVSEANFYDKLQLHSMAEWYLGLFQEEGVEEGISGLVMKNLGKRISSFDALSRKQKKSLYNSVVKIHSADIKHNDLNPRNVIVDQDRNIHVIDYHLAEEHNCPGENACDELLDLVDELDIAKS